jgi:hypothetical protein
MADNRRQSTRLHRLRVGRTTFWNALEDYRAQKITRDAAVARSAASYRAWVDLFESVSTLVAGAK